MSGEILILDDDDDLRALIQATLEGAGYPCVQAADVAAAQELAKAKAFALIVLDPELPGAAAWLAEASPAPAALRLMPSGASRADQRARLGGDEAIDLPLSTDELLLRVHAALPGGDGEAPLRSSGLDPKAELRATFASSLPARLDALEAAMLAGAKGDIVQLDHARRRATRLQSTAATFDFSRVAAAASRLVQVCDGLARGQVGAERELSALLARARAGARAMQVPHPGPSATGGVRVLLVLADPEALQSAAVVGRRRDLHLSRASSTKEALSEADRHRPDLAVIDLDLHGEASGFEALAALRSTPGLDRLPVAFLSSRADLTTRLAASSAGAELLVRPPLTGETLEEVSHALLQQRHPDAPRAVLITEPGEEAERLTGLLQQSGIDVSPLHEPGGLLDALAERRPDLLVVDVGVRGVGPFSLIRVLRADLGWQSLPVLLVNGPDHPASVVAAQEAGADAWIPAAQISLSLGPRARAATSRYRAARRGLARDPLTGLLRRGLLCELLDARLSETRRRAEILALAIITIDGFEELGRSAGFAARRELSATVGRIIGDRFRKHDISARWDHERFLVVFLNERPSSARLALHRVLGVLRGLHLELDAPGGRAPRQLTCSAGVASFPVDGTSVEELVDAATRRLSKAQAQGGDRILV